MHIAPLDSIRVADNRQRKEFDPEKLAELSDSIASTGLMHPVVCRREGHDLFLVAGERRMRAIENLHMMGVVFKCNGQTIDTDQVPYLLLGELSALQAQEAEYEENAVRADLSWQEKAQALERLDNLRALQAKAEGRTHTVIDTAEEVTGRRDAGPVARVRQSIALAKVLDRPEIAKAKSLDDAFKILKKQEQAAKFADLAAAVGDNVQEFHTAHNGDAREVLRGLPASSFDVILTDPPYGMGADEFGDAAGKLVGLTHEYSDTEDYFKDLMMGVIDELNRVAKPAAHIYLFCDIDGFHYIRNLLDSAGWKTLRTPLILHKQGSGRVPHPEHGPRRQYELIAYAWRGDKPVNMIRPDVISVAGDENLGHGAQKPVAAYVDLLERSVRPGDCVLDPFMGTGTIFPAATAVKCKATGIELATAAYGIAVSRIKGEK